MFIHLPCYHITATRSSTMSSTTNNNNGNLPHQWSGKSSSNKNNNSSFLPPKTPARNDNKNTNDAALSDVASKSVNKPRKKQGIDDGDGNPLYKDDREFAQMPPGFSTMPPDVDLGDLYEK